MKNIIYLLFPILLLLGCKNENLFQEQLDTDIAIIEAHLSDNGITAIKDASGVFYKIDEEGIGEEFPTSTSTVKVAYTGKLLDGTVFDSADAANPLSANLQGNLIQGWKIGIPKFKKQSKGTLYIPSGYGYGVNGAGSIAGNTILIFDIEVLNF